MKKVNAVNEINRLKAVNCFVAPTIEIDNGANGKSFEGLVKLYFTKRVATKNLVTSNHKHTDMKFKGFGKIEVKTACGEICQGYELDFSNWLKNEWVIYYPAHGIENVYLIQTQDFINIITSLGLTKYNKSRNKWNIQTFYNSRKKMIAFENALNVNSWDIISYNEILEKVLR